MKPVFMPEETNVKAASPQMAGVGGRCSCPEGRPDVFAAVNKQRER